MKKALILTGNLAQDHEFIYPFYRVQEEGYEVDVAVRGGEQVNGIIGSKIVPTKFDLEKGLLSTINWYKNNKIN